MSHLSHAGNPIMSQLTGSSNNPRCSTKGRVHKCCQRGQPRPTRPATRPLHSMARPDHWILNIEPPATSGHIGGHVGCAGGRVGRDGVALVTLLPSAGPIQTDVIIGCLLDRHVAINSSYISLPYHAGSKELTANVSSLSAHVSSLTFRPSADAHD